MEADGGMVCLWPGTIDRNSPTTSPIIETLQNTTGKEKIMLIFRKEKEGVLKGSKMKLALDISTSSKDGRKMKTSL